MRRSKRVTAMAEKAEKESKLKRGVEEGSDEGLKVIDCGEKGRGVATERNFSRGDYVCLYQGELIPQKIGQQRYTSTLDTVFSFCFLSCVHSTLYAAVCLSVHPSIADYMQLMVISLV